jgi:hypothetical protein
MAHCVISGRCGNWPLLGHSGLCRNRPARQIRSRILARDAKVPFMEAFNVADLHEDLAGLAALGFRLSSNCAPACRDYHATWTYRRIMGSVGGVEADGPALLPLIRSIDSAPDTRRWLLAGSADSGLLAMVAAGLARPETAEFTLIDRCPTPLAVCQAYAETAQLKLTTRLAELMAFEHHQQSDVVIAHSALAFIPPDRQRDVLAHLRGGLRQSGYFVLCTRWGSLTPDPRAREERVLKALEVALTNGVVSLPEPRPEFEQRLRHDSSTIDSRSYLPATVEACADLLRGAGFSDVLVTNWVGGTSQILSQRSHWRAILHARA